MNLLSPGSENTLANLRKFEANATNSCLFGSTEALIRFSFGSSRQLWQVVSRATNDKDLVPECSQIAQRLFFMCRQSLRTMMAKYKDSNFSLPSADMCALVEAMKLFWEVQTIRAVEGIFVPETLQQIDLVLTDIEHCLFRTGRAPSPLFKTLPKAMLLHFGRGCSPVRQPSPPTVSRDDGVVTGLCIQKAREEKRDKAVEKEAEKEETRDEGVVEGAETQTAMKVEGTKRAETEEEKKQTVVVVEQPQPPMKKTFAQRIFVILKSIKDSEEINTQEMLQLSRETPPPTKEEIAALNIWQYVLNTFVWVIQRGNQEETDAYWAMVKTWFMSVEHKNLLIQSFYTHSRGVFMTLPKIHTFITKFDQELVSWINRLKDGNWVAKDESGFQIARDHIAWHLMLSPRFTLIHLLTQAIQSKEVVPAVNKIFEYTRCLFEEFSDATGREKKPLLISAFYKLFESESVKWESEEQSDAFVHALSSLCRQKMQRTPEGRVAVVKTDALINGQILLSHFVFPLLFDEAKRGKHLKFLVDLLFRVVSSNSERWTPFAWTNQFGADTKDDTLVRAPELVFLVHDLLTEFEGKDVQLAKELRRLLHRLMQKLKADGVEFQQATCDRVAYLFSSDPWYLKYAVVMWGERVLGSMKAEIPCGLHTSFSLEAKEKHLRLTPTADFSLNECFFRSLFELAFMDVELYGKLIEMAPFPQYACSLPGNERLIEKIAIGLIATVGQPYLSDKVAECCLPVLTNLCDLLDPHTPSAMPFLKQVSATSFDAVNRLRPVLILEAATKIAIAKSLMPQVENTNELSDSLHKRDPKVVADQILQAYCAVCREVVDNAREEIQQEHKKKIMNVLCDPSSATVPPTVSPLARVDVHGRINLQLTLLFNGVCSIASLMPDSPSQHVQVLINLIVDLLPQLMKLLVGPRLDQLKAEHLKGEVVYAYSQPGQPAVKDGNTVASNANGKPVSSKDIPATTTSAVNRLFDQTTTAASLPLSMSRPSQPSTSHHGHFPSPSSSFHGGLPWNSGERTPVQKTSPREEQITIATFWSPGSKTSPKKEEQPGPSSFERNKTSFGQQKTSPPLQPEKATSLWNPRSTKQESTVASASTSSTRFPGFSTFKNSTSFQQPSTSSALHVDVGRSPAPVQTIFSPRQTSTTVPTSSRDPPFGSGKGFTRPISRGVDDETPRGLPVRGSRSDQSHFGPPRRSSTPIQSEAPNSVRNAACDAPRHNHGFVRHTFENPSSRRSSQDIRRYVNNGHNDTTRRRNEEDYFRRCEDVVEDSRRRDDHYNDFYDDDPAETCSLRSSSEEEQPRASAISASGGCFWGNPNIQLDRSYERLDENHRNRGALDDVIDQEYGRPGFRRDTERERRRNDDNPVDSGRRRPPPRRDYGDAPGMGYSWQRDSFEELGFREGFEQRRPSPREEERAPINNGIRPINNGARNDNGARPINNGAQNRNNPSRGGFRRGGFGSRRGGGSGDRGRGRR